MESSDKKEASSRGNENFNLIKAYLILDGSPDDIDHSIIEEIDVPEIIHD